MGRKGPNKKTLEKALSLKQKKQRFARLSVVSLGLAVLCFIGYSFLAQNGFLENGNMAMGFIVNAVFMVLAGVVGVCTYQWTKASRELKEFIAGHAISETDI